MNKIIVIEGTDASGKETQSSILVKRLRNAGYNVKSLSFPNYNSPACEPVKMYLAGEFGKKAKDVNPYQASLMFAVDRISSYLKDWKKDIEDPNGPILVLDRYTTSNLIHQLSKIDDVTEFREFHKNIKFIEHELCKLPEAGKVFFLRMPTEKALELKKDRLNKATGGEVQDIHENDIAYMKKSFRTAIKISLLENWDTINCVDEHDNIRTIDDIASEIFHKSLNFLKKIN